MKYLRSLSLAFVFSFVPSFASADDPSLAEWTQHRVEEGIVKPLAARSSRFSRSRPPPHQSRVRVTQTTLTRDKRGREFVPFSIDVRFGGDDWQENDIVGCAYRGSGELYVKRGDQFYPAAMLLGKMTDPAAGVCQAAPARS